MQISYQLAAASPTPSFRPAASSPTQSGPPFQAAFRAASAQGETSVRPNAALAKSSAENHAQTSSARASDKSKRTSFSEESTGAATGSTDAPAGMPDSAALAALLPIPSAPENPASASSDAVASQAGMSVLPEGSTSLIAPVPGDQQRAGAATALEIVAADAARMTAEATEARTASSPADELIPDSGTKPSARTTASSSKALLSSASNGTGAISTSPAALDRAETGTQRDALTSAPMSAPIRDRPSAGEVRGKRKDTAADGSVLEHGSPMAATPFAVKLAEAQAPVQAGANNPHSADPAALEKTLDGSQPLISASTPDPAQNPAPSAEAASTKGATPSVPVASADVSVETLPVPGATSAQLIQSAGQSEMRLGMHSAEFGTISISTSVSHQAISAQISLDHPELGRALALHLLAIEEKLGTAYGLHARVEVRDGSAASQPAADAGQGGGGQAQTGSARGGQGRSGSVSSPLSGGTAAKDVSTNLTASSASLAAPAERPRLDIRI